MKSKKSLIIVVVSFFVILFGVVGVFAYTRNNDSPEVALKPTPLPEPVNIIEISKRPYVVLQPLSTRNEISLSIDQLKIPADEVEVTLEYDRNEGVLDAILRSLLISTTPLEEILFLGSKSAGGHITYHDDVIGGTIKLEFEGEEPYALENPWRYDDKQTSYEQFSTSDSHFQVSFEEPYKTPKIIAMQSPGLPENLDGEIIAGPYLFRGVGALPEGEVDVTIRLSEASPEAMLFGWDGEEWQALESTVDGKTLTSTTDVYEVYVVIKS